LCDCPVAKRHWGTCCIVQQRHKPWWLPRARIPLHPVGPAINATDPAGALAAYSEAKGIREWLAASDPGNAGWQRDLIVSHWRLADLLEEMADQQAEAAAHWSQALEIARRLADEGRLAPADGHVVEELERRLAAASQAR
jgi:hypothetical protein